jgi:hypothetical protein
VIQGLLACYLFSSECMYSPPLTFSFLFQLSQLSERWCCLADATPNQALRAFEFKIPTFKKFNITQYSVYDQRPRFRLDFFVGVIRTAVYVKALRGCMSRRLTGRMVETLRAAGVPREVFNVVREKEICTPAVTARE